MAFPHGQQKRGNLMFLRRERLMAKNYFSKMNKLVLRSEEGHFEGFWKVLKESAECIRQDMWVDKRSG